MSGLYMLLGIVAAMAACDFEELQACAISPQMCRLWRFDCVNHAELKVDFAATRAVQVYVLPGDAGCDGGAAFGLCGFPGETDWCRETRLVATEGPCTLVVRNADDLNEAVIDGSFALALPGWVGLTASGSADVLVGCGLFIALCGIVMVACVRSGAAERCCPRLSRAHEGCADSGAIELEQGGPGRSEMED
ncbi:MAG TPA: hypothetical protein VNI01_05150 [Elusimicrobiota bacterium]|jgi:hypothetical protein|nr:hypothetical protein [Elusimicrobiota bacterium]